MGVYNDMANDAGYAYETDENAQMAAYLEADHMRQAQEHYELEAFLEEIGRWITWWQDLGRIN